VNAAALLPPHFSAGLGNRGFEIITTPAGVVLPKTDPRAEAHGFATFVSIRG
jgi:hypothetical protein